MPDRFRRSLIDACDPAYAGENKWLYGAELVLFALGATLLTIFAAYRISAFWHSRAALQVFAENRKNQNLTMSATAMNSGGASFDLWSSSRIKEYEQSLRLNVESPIAVLVIRKIRLEVPVFVGTSDVILNRGTGWIEGTAWPGQKGNVAIAGHRDGFFRALRDISVGDAIELQTLDEIDSYVVDRIDIVDPSDVSVLRSGGTPKLTLVTCYPFYFVGSAPQRYIVEATEISTERPRAEIAAVRARQNPSTLR